MKKVKGDRMFVVVALVLLAFSIGGEQFKQNRV
jgi:hypothetical protein